jgi:hypothetical protein
LIILGECVHGRLIVGAVRQVVAVSGVVSGWNVAQAAPLHPALRECVVVFEFPKRAQCSVLYARKIRNGVFGAA